MTKIEWTDETWNPIAGCSIVSPGCTNCYAMTMAARIARMNPDLEHYRGLTQPSKAGPVWTGKVALAPDATLTKPLTWRRPRRVFVNSMSDLFHDDVPNAWIDRVFAVMALSPQHTFQVLTKRSARMREYMVNLSLRRLADAWPKGSLPFSFDEIERAFGFRPKFTYDPETPCWPLPNVWLGVSCERQQEADARIPDLLATPAAVRYVSAEPLLGPIDFTRITSPKNGAVLNALEPWHSIRIGGGMIEKGPPSPTLDWVIVGGESGANARPMHPDWARSIRDQCKGADAGGHPKRRDERVAFFFKQWGAFAPASVLLPGAHLQEDADTMLPASKARAGRLLDGREWNEYPEVRQQAAGSSAEPAASNLLPAAAEQSEATP